jgi:hypothetical protein
MSTITADPKNMHSVLTLVKEVTEIRDGAGNLIGMFTPTGKTDPGVEKQQMLIVFEDGRSVIFDLQRARETLAREKDLARPFREIIRELEDRARKQG